MVNYRDSVGNDEIEGSDGVGQSNGEDIEESYQIDSVSSSGGETSCFGSRMGSEACLAERLTDILVNGDGGDLLLQHYDRENRVLQWLQALDMQVMGACRSDERLKPLLKSTCSSSMAEDRLLAQLSQHFEPAEVGMLARCFCLPLVSIRVGKIEEQGTRLFPSAIRGNLNLIVLPTSDFCISFIGDDGNVERLFSLGSRSQCITVEIDEIPADSSGRSFAIKVSRDQAFYFWCSEKSKLLGIELLAKMKDLVNRRPSIAELTGINESRLSCFATHLCSNLAGSTFDCIEAKYSAKHLHLASSTGSSDADRRDEQNSSISTKSTRSRHIGGGPGSLKANSLHWGSLSPRSGSFKEGSPRAMSSLRDTIREKLRRRGDNHTGGNQAVPPLAIASSTNDLEGDNAQELSSGLPFPNSSFLESLENFYVAPTANPASQPPSMVSSFLSPHYCWCPSGASNSHHSAESAQLPISVDDSTPLPPLSSLLSSTLPPIFLPSSAPLNLPDVSSMSFPAFFPDPLARLQMQTSQQFPTFTPLMCDPIVHIPVIDICSSGQGYLVSAGPTMSINIPPRHPKFVNPMIPEPDSLLEKDARETLRLLISSSSQINSPLMDVLPAVLTNADKNQRILVTGSRGIYCGARDIDVITNGVAAMGLVSFSGRSLVDDSRQTGCDKFGQVEPERSSDSESENSCTDNEG